MWVIILDFNTIVSIHGAPRSGTSWVGQIFESSPDVRYKFQPLFSYAFKERVNLNSSSNDLAYYFNAIYNFKDDFLDQTAEKLKGIYPIFENKNSTPKFLVTKMVRYHYLIPHFIEFVPNIKIIAIVRHPCGVINSWRKAPKEFNPTWNLSAEWEFAQSKNRFRPEEYYGFIKWKELTKLFLEMEKKYKNSIQIIQYEHLLDHPVNVTEMMFEFSGLNVEQQTLDFIQNSTTINQSDEYSVFKGGKKLYDWENELDSIIKEKVLKDLEGTEFERFLNF